MTRLAASVVVVASRDRLPQLPFELRLTTDDWSWRGSHTGWVREL